MTPTTPNALRIAALFKRRPTTPWVEKEVRVYKKLYKAGYLVPENLEVIERYYAFQRRKESGIHRRDLYTFLNNFSGELDRARAWDEEEREKAKRKAREPRQYADPYEQQASPEQWAKAGEEAKKMLADLKRRLQPQGVGDPAEYGDGSPN